MSRTLAILALVSGVSSLGQAQTTETVAFQGRAEDALGVPIPDAAYRSRFSIFDVATGGTPLWTESNPNVLIQGGRFSVELGRITPFPAGLFGSTVDLYLEVAIDTEQDLLDADDIQAPRTPLNAVPVALVAKDANALGGMAADDFATDGELLGVEADTALALAEKADQDAVDAALAGKADAADLDAKADQATVDTALATKADADDVLRWERRNSGPIVVEPNTGYIVNNVEDIVLTFPPTEDWTIGDRVRLISMGPEDWEIQPNGSQRILARDFDSTNFLEEWTPRDEVRDWTDVASSDDGEFLIAAARGDHLYTSRDRGETWAPRESVRDWVGVDTTPDGEKLFAVVDGGQIYTSDDAGETWIPRDNNRDWRAIGTSADGMDVVACAAGDFIYQSDDGGATFTARDVVRDWTDVAAADDQGRFFASVSPGFLYTSGNGGVTWPEVGRNGLWVAVASSGDGEILAAIDTTSSIVLSRDRGSNFLNTFSASSRRDITISTDGRTFASAGGSTVFIDPDLDESFGSRTLSLPESPIAAITTSGDGARFLAAVEGGRLYTYSRIVESTTTGGGGLIGRRNSEIELLYIDDDTFMPRSVEGEIDAF